MSPHAESGSLRLCLIVGLVLAGAFAWAPSAAHGFGFTTTHHRAGIDAHDVATGDFNGDSRSDLAVVNVTSRDVSILLATASGGFTGPVSYGVGNTPTTVAVADYDEDGNADLAVANRGSDDVSILLGRGDGTFEPDSPTRRFVAGASPFWVVAADFDNDHHLDLAVSNYLGIDAEGRVSILRGSGDGTFTAGPQGSLAVGLGPEELAEGDFNSDGDLDLAVTNYFEEHVSVLLGNGDGSFEYVNANNGRVFTGQLPIGVTVGDLNHDAKDDLAVANYGAIDLNRGSVAVLLGDGAGGFSAPHQYVLDHQPMSIAVADYDGDSHPDLATAYQAYEEEPGIFDAHSVVWILLGEGGGTFSPFEYFDVGSGPSAIAAGDFNIDGHPDLAVANNGTEAGDNDASVLRNTSNNPPDCSKVGPAPALLWPPNHQYRPIALVGATDPERDQVTLTITGVTQDEPLNGRGDGNTSPDAKRATPSNQVYVRSERSGLSDGRVYRIAFTGSDGKGGTCSGTALAVAVPHGRGSTAVDSAPSSYNSFGP